MTTIKSILLASLICAAATISADGQEPSEGLRIGVLAPNDGSYRILGDQVLDGIAVFANSVGGAVRDIVWEPDSCDRMGGADAATAFVESRVDAVIGFLCMKSLMTALPILSESGIPAITLSVRSGIVAEDATKNGWPFFRLAPRADDEAGKLAEVIASEWRGEPIAMVDDGAAYGRDLVESVRLLLQEIGITPVYMDNYRTEEDGQFGLVRRLEKSGATHIFIGGDRRDAAIIARNSKEIGSDFTFLGGDALNAAESDPPLPDGVLAVTTPDPSLLDSSIAAQAHFQNADRIPEGYGLPAFAAGEILLAAKRASIADDLTMEEALRARPVQTAIGPIEFDEFGERMDNPFRMMIWRDGGFQPDGQPPEPEDSATE